MFRSNRNRTCKQILQKQLLRTYRCFTQNSFVGTVWEDDRNQEAFSKYVEGISKDEFMKVITILFQMQRYLAILRIERHNWSILNCVDLILCRKILKCN